MSEKQPTLTRKLPWLFLLLTAMPICLPTSTSAEEQPFSMPQRGACAHRGASSTHPENTLPAFEEAIRLGAAMIEFDVALTKDGQLILMHDHTIDRTTNASGRVSDWTLKDLKELDAGSWKEARFKETRIATLDEALSMMPVNIWLNVHLKGGRELAEETAKTIARHNRLHQAFLACHKASARVAQKIEAEILICNMEYS
ncbi:MAG: glycerophosphodiester phosphodiesterase [Planctomycetota bacterium]